MHIKNEINVSFKTLWFHFCHLLRELKKQVLSSQLVDNAAPLPVLLYHGRRKARTTTVHTETVTGIDHPAFQETSCSPGKKGGKMDL